MPAQILKCFNHPIMIHPEWTKQPNLHRTTSQLHGTDLSQAYISNSSNCSMHSMTALNTPVIFALFTLHVQVEDHTVSSTELDVYHIEIFKITRNSFSQSVLTWTQLGSGVQQPELTLDIEVASCAAVFSTSLNLPFRKSSQTCTVTTSHNRKKLSHKPSVPCGIQTKHINCYKFLTIPRKQCSAEFERMLLFLCQSYAIVTQTLAQKAQRSTQ